MLIISFAVVICCVKFSFISDCVDDSIIVLLSVIVSIIDGEFEESLGVTLVNKIHASSDYYVVLDVK